MLDHGGRFFLGEEIGHLAEHLVREFAHVLIRPILGFGEGKDGGELLGRDAAVLRLAVGFVIASGRGRRVFVAASVRARLFFLARSIFEIQMESNPEERGAFLDGIRGCGFEIVADRDFGFGFLRPGDLGFPELAFGDA